MEIPDIPDHYDWNHGLKAGVEKNWYYCWVIFSYKWTRHERFQKSDYKLNTYGQDHIKNGNFGGTKCRNITVKYMLH